MESRDYPRPEKTGEKRECHIIDICLHFVEQTYTLLATLRKEGQFWNHGIGLNLKVKV